MTREEPSSRLAPLTDIMDAYLRRILRARVYEIAEETPLELASALSSRLGNSIYLKREDQQIVHSFKLRGAYNKMVSLSKEELERGVICSSAGNHAQGVALAAKRLGTHAVIVMPETTPELKIEAVRAHGAEIVLSGDSYSDAYERAKVLREARELVFIHPFDDPEVIAGQGTIAVEMLRQAPRDLDAIFVPIGGGGLIAGIAAYVKSIRPEIAIIGVQMRDSDAMLRSVKSGAPVELEEVGLFSDGTAVKRVGDETFALAAALVDEYVVVDTDAVCAAIRDVFEDTRSIVEPAGAMGVAAIKAYIAKTGASEKRFATITSGANMNFDRLRFVAERAEVGDTREALFAVTIPEEKGSFRRLASLIGARAITEFNYRYADRVEAHVFVGLSVRGRGEAEAIRMELEAAGLKARDLTDDELAKTHLRHLVGGRPPREVEERLFRFVFPERPGALLRFLNTMRRTFNISLFHYRNQGADYGRALVGLEVPESARGDLDEFLRALSYPYEEETENPIYRLFLR